MQLNPQQFQAVNHNEGPLLILAGAGSGKTRVIINRIVRLLEEKIVTPAQICAVTFTNKSAGEMKERLRKSLNRKLRGIFIGTFHSMGLKILRENTELLPAPMTAGFSILGKDDQISVAMDVLREFQIPPESLDEKALCWMISQAKNSGSPDRFLRDKAAETGMTNLPDLGKRYGDILAHTNCTDFDDLLLLPRNLLRENTDLREKYRSRWNYFLVDEFQDTNPLQFEIIRLLLSPPNNLCVVGDDDQSIYGWRGADISIILDFKKNFADAEIIYLEQNYRSRQNILDLANALISNNTHRHEKKLWSARGRSDTPIVMECDTPNSEGEAVAGEIRKLHARGVRYGDMAILFRTNFQSRAFEEALRLRSIPYNVIGSYQFYDRKEIRDIISYLRFFANHADEKSLIRILNFPRRNIGDKSLSRLRDESLKHGLRLFELIEKAEELNLELPSAALSGLLEFRDITAEYAREIRKPGNIARTVEKLLRQLDFEKEFLKSSLEEKVIRAKMQNISELMRSLVEFETGDEDGKKRDIYDYLQYIALMTADDRDEEAGDRVNVMTLHNSKGLEFPVVFLAGLSDGLIPHQKTIDEGRELEEERRLFYVGITRAKDHLFFSFSRSLKTFGGEIATEPSRFLLELPADKLEWNRAEEDGSGGEMEDLMAQLDAL